MSVASSPSDVSPLGQLRAMGFDLAKSTKDAGLDFIYSIDARLKDLHGGTENWRYLFDKGKLTVLSAFGSMAESRDAAYDRRRHAIVTTRRLVTAIEKEFSAVVAALGALGDHHAALCTLLQQFRRECDLHIATSADEPPSDGSDDDEDTAQPRCSNADGGTSALSAASSPGQRKAGSPQRESDFINISSSEREALRSVADDDTMHKFEMKMKAMFAELNETVKGSCLGISKSSIHQIDEAYVKITSSVNRAQTAFDTKRRETAVIAREVEALKAEVAELTQRHQPGGSVHSSSSSSNTKLSARSTLLEQREQALSERCQEQEKLLVLYRTAVGEGMKNLHFALEQVSMSTWSTYNIFFAQLGNFFDEATVETRRAAKALVDLKNAQNVARVISEEKKHRMAQAASAAASTSRVDSSPPLTSPIGTGVITAASATAAVVGDELDELLSTRAPLQHLAVAATVSQPQGAAASAARRTSQSPPDWEDIFGS